MVSSDCKNIQVVDKEKLVPTRAHMAIVELMRSGRAKYLISQNCDGLHLKSGVLPTAMSEVHGNAFKVECPFSNKVCDCRPHNGTVCSTPTH